MAEGQEQRAECQETVHLEGEQEGDATPGEGTGVWIKHGP